MLLYEWYYGSAITVFFNRGVLMLLLDVFKYLNIKESILLYILTAF